MGRVVDSSGVGDEGCWALMVRVLEGIFNAFRYCSGKQESSILQVGFCSGMVVLFR